MHATHIYQIRQLATFERVCACVRAHAMVVLEANKTPGVVSECALICSSLFADKVWL